MNLSKYNRTNLNNEVWGPFGWFFLDSICLSYPKNPTNKEKREYIKFFGALSYILPCLKCRIHYRRYIIKHPLNGDILKSKDKLIKWILGVHNNVNQINNKKEITLNDFYKYYNKKFNMNVKKETCKVTCELKNQHQGGNKIISIILFGIVISMSLYILKNNNTKLSK